MRCIVHFPPPQTFAVTRSACRRPMRSSAQEQHEHEQSATARSAKSRTLETHSTLHGAVGLRTVLMASTLNHEHEQPSPSHPYKHTKSRLHPMQAQPCSTLPPPGATHRTLPNSIMKHYGNLRPAQPSHHQFENAPGARSTTSKSPAPGKRT